jgi:hypothetical protein
LILYRDASLVDKPITLKFDTVQGVAYRLLNKGDHLFLLTSIGLYALMDLAGRLREGRLEEKSATSILPMQVEAVDANLVAGQWLLVITPHDVLRLDLQMIEQSEPNNLTNGERREALPRRLTPRWEVNTMAGQLVGTPG